MEHNAFLLPLHLRRALCPRTQGGYPDFYACHSPCGTLGCFKPCMACVCSCDKGVRAEGAPAPIHTAFWWVLMCTPCLCCVHGFTKETRKDAKTIQLEVWHPARPSPTVHDVPLPCVPVQLGGVWSPVPAGSRNCANERGWVQS